MIKTHIAMNVNIFGTNLMTTQYIARLPNPYFINFLPNFAQDVSKSANIIKFLVWTSCIVWKIIMTF
jgi:hypothetical protein